MSKRGQCCRFVRRGEVRSPENSLLCVFGQANPAPTAGDWIGRFSFDTLPFLKLVSNLFSLYYQLPSILELAFISLLGISHKKRLSEASLVSSV